MSPPCPMHKARQRLRRRLAKLEVRPCKCSMDWPECDCRVCRNLRAGGEPSLLLFPHPCRHVLAARLHKMSLLGWIVKLEAAYPFPEHDPYPFAGTKQQRESWHRRRQEACGQPELDHAPSQVRSPEGRLDVLTRRYEGGVSLWHPEDAVRRKKAPPVELKAETENGKAGRRRNGSERIVLRRVRRRKNGEQPRPRLSLQDAVVGALIPYLRSLRKEGATP